MGPELADAMRRCVDATGVKIDWEVVQAGEAMIKEKGTPLPDDVLDSIRKNKLAIKGPITTPIGTGFRSVNVLLRKELNLYSCLRPCKSYAGVRGAVPNIDLVIVRENTEDLYAGIEYFEKTSESKAIISQIKSLSPKTRLDDESAISIKPISAAASRRIVKFAFDYAVAKGRKLVTAVHKANIMKATDGLFLRVAQEVAKEYAGKVEFNDRIVDNMCMQLVQRPMAYDVMVLPNLYGDIVSDLCAGLIGGLGIAPGANIGDGIAVFEATHGSAPKYTGKNMMNPSALIFSAVMMLEHIGEANASARLDKALADVLREGRDVTYDMKANLKDDPTSVGTSQMADAIIRRLRG